MRVGNSRPWRSMVKKHRIKLANTAKEWAEVLEQPTFQSIVDRLATRRAWQIDDTVEAGEAGWKAHVREGKTIYLLSLTVAVEIATDPPPRVIEWTLEADAERDERNRTDSIALGTIMAGMGVLLGWLGSRLGAPRFVVPILAFLGIFPVGLFAGILALHPFAVRRKRRGTPVEGRAAFLKEVAAAVAQLPAEL